jgi:hypothetical protein
MAALLLTFGLVLAGCPTEDDDEASVPGAGGSLTITGIDSDYNGQYASFRSSSNTKPTGGDYLFGGTNISASGTITGVQISGGSVTIPVNLVNETYMSASPYNGSDEAIKIYVIIKDSSSFSIEDDLLHEDEAYTIESVNFTDGSASVNVDGDGDD